MFAAAPLLAFALAAIPSANAFFRIPCGGNGNALLRERVDPIVSPGKAAGHQHTIHGGQAFSMNYTFEDARNSACTSCEVTTDKSNYWIPTLFFQDPKTKTFEQVPNGGLLAYYQQRGDNKTAIQPYPPGFRMLTGDMTRRVKRYEQDEGSQAELEERATKFTCLRYTAGFDGYDGYGFPTTRCEGGFQARLHMPNCWDGKNLDSADHKSHVAYMSRLDNGFCPPSHPVYFMSLFYEITWSTDKFDDRWDPATDAWPFVYSMGDPTGHGMHGDFVNGWDVEALRKAITECDNNTPGTASGRASECPHLVMQTGDQAQQCKGVSQVPENSTGVLDRLPGCNPIQAGPENATPYSTENCPLDGGATPEPTPAPETPAPAPEDPTPSESTEVPIPAPTTNIAAEPTTTDEPVEPTPTAEPEEPTSTEAPVEPTTTPAPEVPVPGGTATVTETVTQTVTVTASPECSTTAASFHHSKHHRRSEVPHDFVRGRASERFQPRRR